MVPTGVEASSLASATIRELNHTAVTPAHDIVPHDQVSSTFMCSAFHVLTMFDYSFNVLTLWVRKGI